MKELYFQDSYMKEFTSKVISLGPNFIELEKTAFYPTGGGQPCDTGKILFGKKESKVVEVVKSNGKILHFLNGELPELGAEVTGFIDWGKRYMLMRMHTAAHILCAIFFKKANALITGNQLGIEKSRIDFGLENFNRELMEHLFAEANEIVNKALEVKSYFISRQRAMKNPEFFKLANKLPPATKNLRIVEISGFDRQADGGTHVKNTKEIGKIELLSLENRGKNNRRAYFRVI